MDWCRSRSGYRNKEGEEKEEQDEETESRKKREDGRG